jgi:hypothetical protein
MYVALNRHVVAENNHIKYYVLIWMKTELLAGQNGKNLLRNDLMEGTEKAAVLSGWKNLR